MQNMHIRNLGPVKECKFDVNGFTILTGAQASGKSTLAKAIYFFRTLKTDVYEEITRRRLLHWHDKRTGKAYSQ